MARKDLALVVRNPEREGDECNAAASQFTEGGKLAPSKQR